MVVCCDPSSKTTKMAWDQDEELVASLARKIMASKESSWRSWLRTGEFIRRMGSNPTSTAYSWVTWGLNLSKLSLPCYIK